MRVAEVQPRRPAFVLVKLSGRARRRSHASTADLEHRNGLLCAAWSARANSGQPFRRPPPPRCLATGCALSSNPQRFAARARPSSIGQASSGVSAAASPLSTIWTDSVLPGVGVTSPFALPSAVIMLIAAYKQVATTWHMPPFWFWPRLAGWRVAETRQARWWADLSLSD